MSIFISLLDDPYRNLAIERVLFLQFQLHGLYIWRNRPAVIIGRNQNPWQECVMPQMRQHDVRLCRRISGGGSVFHDAGNINCSFFTHTDVFSREDNLRLVQQALEKLDVTLAHQHPHDLLLSGRKISGSAFRVEKNRALHHLTLLCDSDIDSLWQVLRRNAPAWMARGTRSRVAEVGTIRDQHPHISVADVEQAIIAAYQAQKNSTVHTITESSLPEGWEQYYRELSSWEWIIGKTPSFDITTDSFRYVIEEGRVICCTDLLNEHRKSAMLVGHSLQYEQCPTDADSEMQELYRRLEI